MLVQDLFIQYLHCLCNLIFNFPLWPCKGTRIIRPFVCSKKGLKKYIQTLTQDLLLFTQFLQFSVIVSAVALLGYKDNKTNCILKYRKGSFACISQRHCCVTNYNGHKSAEFLWWSYKGSFIYNRPYAFSKKTTLKNDQM